MNFCLGKIYYMDLHKYYKIHNLYSNYNNCMFDISKDHDRITCSSAKSCAESYNYIKFEYIKQDDTKFCNILNELKDILDANILQLTSNCTSSFSDLLSYPHHCNELLKKKEQGNSFMKHPNTELELQGALVSEQGVRVSAVGEPVGGTDTEEKAIPVGTIIGTSLGFFIPLAMLYKEKLYNTLSYDVIKKIKNNIFKYKYLSNC
ncbi:hypothetical protein PCYB_005860 [Plasmodium cynomolgi strain B]|uniref:Uncharacterized protein n=1 Tax=Plasmodium cynomolgi (strain B) TaxID=1120755 RepID=K6VK64_PLACD|nr:hypothetical protein PCYB_005860 [Plasmodium cynomolgi strain B]GAB69837.1 hypothetical protein PCYB_005860 [Plasmodium cynomolgi strain B]